MAKSGICVIGEGIGGGAEVEDAQIWGRRLPIWTYL